MKQILLHSVRNIALLMKTLLAVILLLSSGIAWSQSVYFAAGQEIYIGNQVSVPVELVNAGPVTIGGGALQFSGNEYRNLAGAAYSGTGYVVFSAPATGAQSLYGGNIFFRNLRISNGNNVVLAGSDDAGVSDTLDFSSGRLQLGSLNLGMGANAVFTGFSADRYVITNGTGVVRYNTVAAGKSLFYPVGNAGGTDYTPARVKNGTTQQTINMRVQRIPGAGQVPDTAKGIRRVWNIWTGNGGGLDSLVLYHNDSLNGLQYASSAASVNRYVNPSWQTGPCPFSVETLSGGLWALPAHSTLLSNTATSAMGNAYYSKSSDIALPAITPGTIPSVCAGATSTSLSYTGATNSPNQYSIVWSTAAITAGFGNVTNATLPSSPISITVPGAAAPAAYTGTLTVRNSTTSCVSASYNISVTINPNPAITPGANPSVCAGVTSASLSYTGATGNPNQYGITWNTAALSAGFANVPNTTALPSSPVSITVPGAAAPDIYTGTLTVRNSTTGCERSYPVSVTVNVLPTITPGSNPEICAGTTSAELAYTGTTHAPDHYGITWGTAAVAAGFANASNVPLAAAPGVLHIAVPPGAGAAAYSGTLTVGNTACGSTGVAFDVIVHPVPVATITPAGPADVCDGDSVALDAGAPLPGHTYLWRNGVVPVGGNTAAYAADTTGDYTVIVDNGNCADTSSVVQITWHPLPDVTVTPGDTAFCQGGKVILEVAAGTHLSYQWTKDNSPIAGAQAFFYEADETGLYAVTVSRTNVLRCTDTAVPVSVTVHPLPQPVISWDGEVLRTDSVYADYRWYINGQPIPGATSYTFVPAQDGRYTVSVTDSNGCIGTSPSILADKVGIPVAAGISTPVHIYPNPTHGMVYVESPVPVQIMVNSMDGKSLIRATDVTQVDITGLPDGIYMMRVSDEQGMLLKVEKVMKY